jgi:hypothetical protein
MTEELEPMRVREMSDGYFQKADLLASIRKAERLARWGWLTLVLAAGGFVWGFDLEEGLAAVMLFVALAVGVVLGQVIDLKVMVLKMELREVMRYGPPPADREVEDILLKTGRW